MTKRVGEMGKISLATLRKAYVVGSKSFRPDIKSRAKWIMLWGMYSAIYGEVNVSVEKCVEIKGGLCWKIAKLFYFCHLKKLVRPETFGPYYVVLYGRHPAVLMLYTNLQLRGRQTQLITEVHKQLITLKATNFCYLYDHQQARQKVI